MFAIVRSGGKQYRVAEGDVLRVEKLAAEAGDEVDLPVLLLGGDEVRVGTPHVEDVRVVAEVIEHGRGPKLDIYKFKAKNNYRRHRGHRQAFTDVRIARIEGAGGGRKATSKADKAEAPDAKAAETKAADAKAADAKAAEPKPGAAEVDTGTAEAAATDRGGRASKRGAKSAPESGAKSAPKGAAKGTASEKAAGASRARSTSRSAAKSTSKSAGKSSSTTQGKSASKAKSASGSKAETASKGASKRASAPKKAAGGAKGAKKTDEADRSKE